MNEKSIFESQESQIENLQVKVQKYNDSIEKLNGEIMNLNYKTLNLVSTYHIVHEYKRFLKTQLLSTGLINFQIQFLHGINMIELN